MARYITTTLPYVNAEQHIGFALEIVQADVLARTWRTQGEQVFFSTGTDEHGQKIFEAAQKNGEDTQLYVDRFAADVQKLQQVLDLTPDNFIRTTSSAHKYAAQEMWRRCEAAGDIYKKAYVGLYCVGCEVYKTEKELDVDGHCVLHPSLTLERIEEENYFFRLSRYADALLEYLSRTESVFPDWRRNEARTFIESGLEDVSISRNIEKLSWGVPVPGDDTQVMYVWFDALTDYISTLGWPEDNRNTFKEFWHDGVTLQVAGKDQVRFQSILWQAMLMSAKIKNTDTIFYHGFINSGGKRMSKSLGNVISPYDMVARFGTDAVRYMLLRHVHPVEDSDVTWERLNEWYTANLVNGLGNLVARVMQLAQTNLPAPVILTEHDLQVQPAFTHMVECFGFNDAADFIFAMVGESDALMTDREPFKKVKSDDESIRASGIEDITTLVRELAQIATHLAPLMPKTSENILEAIRTNMKPDNLFPRL